MAGGTEVARLAVRVVPNTRNFRQATAASIKRQMKGFKVRIPVSPDTKGFAAEVKAAAKSAAAAASGSNVNFDTDLDTAGLAAKARAAAKAASGNKISFRVAAGSALDRIGRQFARINEGLLRIARNTRQLRTLSRTFNLFGRSARTATRPILVMGRSITSVAKQMQQAIPQGKRLRKVFDNLALSVGYFANDKIIDATKAKNNFLDTPQGQRLVHVFRQVEVGARRATRTVRDLSAVKVMGIKDEFRDIGYRLQQIADSPAMDRLNTSAQKARVSAMKLRDTLRDTPAGFQIEQGFRRAQGAATALRDRIRQIGGLSRRVSLGGGGGGRGSLLGRGFFRIRQEIDNSDRSLGRFQGRIPRIATAFQRAGKKANGFFKNFRQKYFQPDSTIGFIVVAITAAIAPLAGLIGSLLAGLPTLLASVGAAALVVALGFEGIKAAAQPLVAALEPLKKSLSDVFQENLTPQFEKLASVLPAFQGNLEHVARGLTVFSGAFVDAFTSGDNVQKVNTLLARTGNLFAQMAPGMASFTDGFLTMFEGASRGYPAMAKVFNGFADLFNRDMSRLVDTGHMQAAMESLAVVTGSLLTGLHRMFVAGIQVMPQMTKGFTDMFDGIANGIIIALPALAKFSNAAGTGIGKVFEGLGKGIATLGNYLSSSSLGAGISSLFQALAPAIVGVSSAVMEFVGVIGNQLGETLLRISPAIAEFASSLSDKVGTVLQELAPAIGPVISVIGSLVEVILEAAGILLSVFGPVLQVVAILIAAIVPPIAEVIDWFARLLIATSDIWGPILVGIAAVVVAMKVWAAVTAIVIAVKGALTAAIGAVRTAMWFLNGAFYANPIGFVVGLVIAAIAAFIWLGTATDAGREAISRLNGDLSWLRNIITVLNPVMGALIWLIGKFNDFLGNSSGSAESFAEEINNVTDSISGMTSGLAGIPTDMDFSNMGLPQLQTELDGATSSAQGLAGAIPGVDAALAQAGTTAETMSWHVAGIGDAAMGAVPLVEESTHLFSDAFLNMLPGMAEAERRVHEMGVNMGTNIAGVANAVPGQLAPFHEEMFNIPLNANTAMNDTTAILGAGLAGFAATNPDFVGPIKMQFDEIPRAADTAMSSTATALSTGIGDAANSVQTGLAPIPGHVTETGSQMTTEMTTAMTNMNTGIQTGVDNAGTIAGTLVPTVKGAIGDTNALHPSGLALGNSFAQGIRDSIPAARAAAADLAAAVKANMPNSPAKEGPLSGSGYTDESGKALARDFAGGIRSEVGTVSDAARDIAAAAKEGVEQYHKSIDKFHDDNLTQPIMKANARRIHDFRKREAEALEKGNADMEKLAEDRQKMLESLEVPDFREINRSIQSYYIDGTKGLFNQAILKGAADNRFSDQLKQVSLQAVKDAREHFGDHPVMAQVEANVNAEHFAWSIEEAIKAADLGAVPIDLAISNLDQLKSDLGFGDGALTRGLDAVLNFNPNDTDAYRYEKQKEEVHYHVTDLEEAMRLEDERRRRGALRYV